jgi:hypothetical protein
MSDIHVLTGDGMTWSVVMHIPVPDANNSVGVNYRMALVNSGLGGTTSLTEDAGPGPGQISAAEKAQVEAGELYEHRVGFLLESGGTSQAEQRAALRGRYTREKAVEIARLQRQLRYFGHTESET